MAGPHYVTKRLLKEFRGDDLGLRELVKATGVLKPRVSLDNAGAEVGIWPDDVERGPLQQWDNRAHKILGPKVYKRRGIYLTPAERETVQEWLFAFLIRSPANRRLCEVAHDNPTLTAYTNDGIIADYYGNPWLGTRRYAIANPLSWTYFTKKFGVFGAETAMLRHLRLRIQSGAINDRTSGVDTFHGMLRTGGRPYLGFLRTMRWTWLHTIGDFVIGDNPFCRANAAGTYVDYPLEREDLTVFFPLGRHLCLMMHRNPVVSHDADISNDGLRNINRLQIASAEAKVWGPRESALRVDTSGIQRHPIDIRLRSANGDVILDQMV